MNDPIKKSLLMVEMASVVKAGEPLVSATYTLEGDGPLVLEAYEVVSAVTQSVRVADFPNLQSVARHISAGNQHVEQ